MRASLGVELGARVAQDVGEVFDHVALHAFDPTTLRCGQVPRLVPVDRGERAVGDADGDGTVDQAAQRVVRRLRAGARSFREPGGVLHGAVDHRDQEVFLAREVAVHRGAGDADRGADLVDPGLGEPAFAEQPRGGVEDLLGAGDAGGGGTDGDWRSWWWARELPAWRTA